MKKWAKLWIFVAWGLALAHAMVPHHHHSDIASMECGQNENPVSEFFADIDLGDDHLSKYNAPTFIGLLSDTPILAAPELRITSALTPPASGLWANPKPAGSLLRGPPICV